MNFNLCQFLLAKTPLLSIVLCFLILGPTVLSSQSNATSFVQKLMGTKFTILIFGEGDKKMAAEAAFDEIARINMVFSTYEDSSEVSILNATNSWQKASPELLEVISFSEQLNKDSHGAFDIKIGRLTSEWKAQFASGESYANPKIDHEKERIIYFNKDSIRTDLETQLDFGGIAKGYAVDKAFEVLQEMGYDTVLIDGGGDIRVGNKPKGSKGWKINQFYDDNKMLYLENTSIATSGPAYKTVVKEGVSYSHIINPLTSKSLTKDTGVTIISESCMQADALATAITVLGSDKILKDFYEFKVNVKESDGWKIKQF